MADAGMYTTNGDEEEDMTALLHTAVPGSNAAHTSQAQEEAPVPAFGKPFHEDIPKEAGVRSIGEWVHPQQRALREWYGMQCSCGAELTFPWLGFEVVSCPTCGSHVSSEKAVVAKVPGASIQAKAQEDEERLSALVNSEKKKDLAARRFVERFSFMRRRWDTMERLFFGKASLYGRFKMYQNGRIILSPTSSYCVIPPLIVAPALIAMMQLSLPIIWSQIVGAALVAAFIGVTFAHFTEPGILRKGTPGPIQQDIYEEVNGHTVVRKWCRSCHCYRSPRASHCSECDVCVERFDHHCHITGTCVGQRNFKPFVVFVFGIAIADSVGFVALVMKVAYYGYTKDEMKMHWYYLAWSVLGIVWTLITSQMMLSMAYMIYYMSGKGLTTREMMKRLYDPDNHPFHKGSKFANIRGFLFSPTIPSQIYGHSESDLDSHATDNL